MYIVVIIMVAPFWSHCTDVETGPIGAISIRNCTFYVLTQEKKSIFMLICSEGTYGGIVLFRIYSN